jgi:hypothetical protein
MDTFRIDHQYPGCDNSSLTLILYGELGTPEFAQFHAVLEKYAKRKEINYIVRHFVKVSNFFGKVLPLFYFPYLLFYFSKPF